MNRIYHNITATESGAPQPVSDTTSLTEQVVRELLDDAVRSGYPIPNLEVSQRALSGGNTAEMVSEVKMTAAFVVKIDSKNSKVAKEAHAMRNAKEHMGLSKRSRDAWPTVYAIRDTWPYAYLMEYFPREQGWLSLEDRLYAQPISETQAARFINSTLDILMETYASSADPRLRPSLDEDYVSRIKDRLTAVEHDERFISQALLVNGTSVAPWKDYIALLEANADYLASVAPPFTTIVHGDPNPGNMMLRVSLSSVDVKFIDPKEWETGDYIFDISKITHFLRGTGPVEKPASGTPLQVDYRRVDGVAKIDYQMSLPEWTDAVVAACMERAKEFAEARGDEGWLARYELGMAANLLGLPAGRLKKNRLDAALALYGEGLLWLKRFCERLPTGTTDGPLPLQVTPVLEVEPEGLVAARQRVRDDAPQVIETLDRRGFRLLNWPPAHPNAAGKPAELSLEHEARLTPASAADLALLKEALATSISQSSGNALLPDHPLFASWTVHRVERAAGSQSKDLFWDDISSSRKDRLIPRNLTLRQRVESSAFMTWAADGKQRPLNLELPFEAYGDTGVVARLEFNWIDLIGDTLTEFACAKNDGPTSNPLVLAARISGISRGEFKPVLEQTTFREKFLISQGSEVLFHLNVDHVMSQSLSTKRLASFTDVDIAPAKQVDNTMLELLVHFASAMRHRFNLIPVSATKALSGARLVGES